MFIQASICLNEKLRRNGRETRKRKIMEAAAKVNSSPDKLFVFPYHIDDEKILFACMTDRNHSESYYIFLEELGLDPSKLKGEEVTPGKYHELAMEAVEAGYLHTEDFSSYCSDVWYSDFTIPEERYGYDSGNDVLKKRIAKTVKAGDKKPAPVCYYILEGNEKKRKTILEDLFHALSVSEYKALWINDFCNRYGIQWKMVSEVYNIIKNGPVTIFLDDYLNIQSQDNDVIDFAKQAASNIDGVTVFLGDTFEEGLTEVLERNGVTVKLIQDNVYTKHEVINAVKDKIQEYIDDDRFNMPGTKWLFRKIRNCPRKYYSQHERNRFLYCIMNPEIEPYRELRDSFINEYFENEKEPPMEVFAKLPLPSEAKDTIKSVISSHYLLEDEKVRGSKAGKRPVYTKDYCENRKNRPEIATDLPSVNIILCGPQDEIMHSTAKIYADILNECMITAEDKFVRITKGQIISSNPAKTMGLLRRAFDRSMGGVLYIDWQPDEQLFPIKHLLDLIDEYNRKVVVILGLSEQGMFKYQSLLEGQFPYSIHFRPLKYDESWKYLSYLAKEDGFILGKGVKEKLQSILNDPDYGNVNSLRAILERAKMNMSIRIAPSRTALSDRSLTILRPQDFDDIPGFVS